MKNEILILLFSICITLLSCQERVEEKEIAYNQTVYERLLSENKPKSKITVIDTFCINQTKRAKTDIEKGKIIYFMSEFHCEFIGMKKLLKKYNIEVKNYMSFCVVSDKFRVNCYQQEMWKEIDRKLGKKAIDSLMQLAEKDFVLNNPDSLYIKDGIDIRTKYLNVK